MKKFLVLFVGLFAMPAFCACSLDMSKPCTATVIDEVNSTLQDRLAPNPLDDIRKTDAFTQQYKDPYNDALINTSSPNYNSNCQFGVCLPEVQPNEQIIE